MKIILTHLILLCLLTNLTSAKRLTRLKKKGWASYHAGFAGAGIEIAVDTKGQVEFYFTPKKKIRLNRVWPIETQIRIERRDKNKENWVKKKTKLEGFTPMSKIEFGQKKIEYQATVTGGASFKVDISFDKTGVEVQASMVGKPEDEHKADYRLILESKMPNLMKGASKYSEKELKAKTRGDEVKLEFKKEKGQKIRLYEKKDAQKITKSLLTGLIVKADKIGRKKLAWSLLDKKSPGAFELDFKSSNNTFLDGFNLKLILADEKGAILSKGIRLEYK